MDAPDGWLPRQTRLLPFFFPFLSFLPFLLFLLFLFFLQFLQPFFPSLLFNPAVFRPDFENLLGIS